MSTPIPEFPPLTEHERVLVVNALMIVVGQFGATKIEPAEGPWTKSYNALAAKLGCSGPDWGNPPDDRPKCQHGVSPAYLVEQRAQSCWKCEVEVVKSKLAGAWLRLDSLVQDLDAFLNKGQR